MNKGQLNYTQKCAAQLLPVCGVLFTYTAMCYILVQLLQVEKEWATECIKKGYMDAPDPFEKLWMQSAQSKFAPDTHGFSRSFRCWASNHI